MTTDQSYEIDATGTSIDVPVASISYDGSVVMVLALRTRHT